MNRTLALPHILRTSVAKHASHARLRWRLARPYSDTSSIGSQEDPEWLKFPSRIRTLAGLAEDARKSNRQLPHLLTEHTPTLDQDMAFHVAAAICSLRRSRGERPVGRKIGFTNKGIWPEYNIDCSNWSYMYDSTVSRLPGKPGLQGSIDLSDLNDLEPRLEPEIVLQLGGTPKASMSDEELLRCVSSIAHGFEVVQSIFPKWKFTAADTTAAYALHGKLLVGPQVAVDLRSRGDLLKALEGFKVTLSHDGKVIDRGTGANVLGSPIKALRHLCELLEKDPYNAGLAPGELVTTGTLTRAWPIEDSGLWRTEIEGLAVPGLQVRFTGLHGLRA